MHANMKDMNPHNCAPKVTRQQANVQKRRRAHAEHNRTNRVKQHKDQIITGHVATNLRGPRCMSNGMTVKNRSLRAIDDDAPKREHANDFVHGPLADQKLLQRVAEAVKSCAEQGKEVAFECVGGRVVVYVLDLVAGHEDAHAGHADEDAEDGCGSVAHFEEQEGTDDDYDDGPEVD